MVVFLSRSLVDAIAFNWYDDIDHSAGIQEFFVRTHKKVVFDVSCLNTAFYDQVTAGICAADD